MAAPVLTAVDPDTIDIATGDTVLVTITGTGFIDTSVVVQNGADDAGGAFVSDTVMTTNIDTSTVVAASVLQIAVRTDVDVSNELPLNLTGTPWVPDVPDEGQSPNTPAVPADYMSPEPPDVYRKVAEGG